MTGDRSARRWTLAASVLGSAIWFTDTSAVSILVPVIQEDFAVPITTVQWVVEAQILFLASLLLVGGALGDRFGRRRVYMIGVAVYGVAAVAAALAPTPGVLIGARAVGGLGAALLVPGSLALITAVFPRAERGRAFGAWSAMTGVTAAAGPVIAGVLADHVTWRAFFALYLPFTLAVLAVLTRVPESRAENPGPLDITGGALATLGLGGVTTGFLEWNRLGWTHPLVLGALVVGAAALVGFVTWEARTRHPMVPLGMFRNRNFASANGVTLLVYAALSGALFFIPFNLQQVQGYSATEAGLAPLPFPVLMATLSPFAGRLADRVGTRWPLGIGGIVAAAGFALFARPGIGGSYWTTFFPAFVLLGLGLAAFVPSVTTAVMNAAPETRTGTASGVNNAIARAAGLLAIAVFGVIAVTVFTHALPDDAREAIGDDAARLAAAEAPPGAEAVDPGVVDTAFVRAFRVVVLTAAGLTVAGALVGILGVRRDVADAESQ